MKNVFIVRAVTCMSTALIFQTASSQTLQGFASLNTDAKTLATHSAMPLHTEKIYRNDISIRAVRHFVRVFKDADNVTWRKVDDGGFIAQFVQDSVKTTVGYSRRGSWNYILRKYDESKMPVEIKKIVQRAYYDYEIREISEILEPEDQDNIIYRVLINKSSTFKMVQICSKDMRITPVY